VLPVVIILLGLMDALHVLNEVQQLAALPPTPAQAALPPAPRRRQLALRTLRKMLFPYVATMLINVAGFLALLSSPMPILRALELLMQPGPGQALNSPEVVQASQRLADSLARLPGLGRVFGLPTLYRAGLEARLGPRHGGAGQRGRAAPHPRAPGRRLPRAAAPGGGQRRPHRGARWLPPAVRGHHAVRHFLRTYAKSFVIASKAKQSPQNDTRTTRSGAIAALRSQGQPSFA